MRSLRCKKRRFTEKFVLTRHLRKAAKVGRTYIPYKSSSTCCQQNRICRQSLLFTLFDGKNRSLGTARMARRIKKDAARSPQAPSSSRRVTTGISPQKMPRHQKPSSQARPVKCRPAKPQPTLPNVVESQHTPPRCRIPKTYSSAQPASPAIRNPIQRHIEPSHRMGQRARADSINTRFRHATHRLD